MFYISCLGEIAVLASSGKEYLKIGMFVIRDDAANWKITGIGMPKPSDMTNGYNYLYPPR